jgi:predicted permease
VPDFIDFKPQITQLAAFEGETPTQLIVETDDQASRVRGLQVTPGFFDLFGVPAALGRTFVPEDGVPGAEQVVVLGDGFWRDRLGADPDVVGTTIRLSETPYTIAGIAPPGFDYGRASLWIPFQWHPDSISPRGSNFIRLHGRLAPGVEVQAATAELHALWTALGEQYADSYDDSGMRAEPLLQATVSRSRTPLFILAGAVGLVLLVACANVVNIMLARSESRYREIAVRAALGAGRGRLFRQFLTESLVLSLTGGAVGLAAAYAGVRVIIGLYGSAIPRSDEIGISGVALGFAVLVSVLTGVLVGLVPALQAKPNHAALKEGGRGASGRITTIRQGLVITEIALALMLVTGTGILLKSFWRATQSDMGFNGENLLVVNLWTPPSRYQSYAEEVAFYESLLPQLTGLPTIQHAAMSNLIPARAFGNNYTTIAVAGREDERESHFVENRRVTRTYFETLEMRLIIGRNFTEADLDNSGGIIVINEELARQLFVEGENPLGARLGYGWSNPPEIVGVVNDVRSFGPDERPRPTMYWPVSISSNLVLRTAGDPLQVVPQIRQMLSAIDPAVRIYRVDTMSDILTRSLGDRRFQLALLIVFGAVALVLGAVGIYGVMSYTVAQRTRELGVRMALGSSTSSVLRLVLRQGTVLALIGVGVGAAGALVTRKVLANMVFDVSTSDPLTYGAVAVLLTGVAAVACYIPARRAAKVDPMEALRYE